MDKLAVFGKPIAHSISPLIHQEFARLEGRDISYEKILVENTFSEQANAFFKTGAVGCNITVPFKLDALEFADELTQAAIIAGAVNTLKRVGKSDGTYEFLGDNTDGSGFFIDLMYLNCKVENARVLVIGAGGAAHGILPPLMKVAREIVVVNRTVSRAQELIAMLNSHNIERKHNCVLSATSFDAVSGSFDVIINSTSSSMDKVVPPISNDIYASAGFAYDLYYTKSGATVFTDYLKGLGVRDSYDGIGMLIGQAAIAYERWFDYLPDFNQVRDRIIGMIKDR